MRRSLYSVLAWVVCGMVLTAAAEVRLPSVFGDGMVLQRDMAVPVWGWAEPDAEVTVSFAAQSKTTRAGADGAWRVDLDPMPAAAAGGVLTVRSSGSAEPTTVADVLVGEVWVCSGQSNMEWSLSRSINGPEEAAQADISGIRQLRIPHTVELEPQADVKARWKVCTPQTAGGFTAVGFFFARRVHQELGVPVGLINTPWSGSRIEPWIPLDAFRSLPDVADVLSEMSLLRSSLPALREENARLKQEHLRSRKALVDLEANQQLAAAMSDPALDTAEWGEMSLPAKWEEGPLPDFDGMVWFRKTVDVPDSLAGKDLILHLSPIDEVDVTWFNGVRIGATGSLAKNDVIKYWDVRRHYDVPGTGVKAGENVITVRVIDTQFAGGMWSEKRTAMWLEPKAGPGDDPVLLEGPWKYKVQAKLTPAPEPINLARMPTTMYNGMIHPLLPFAVRGALWYQGESNGGEGESYLRKMEALITGWRRAWGRAAAGRDTPAFPFLFVQLANWQQPKPDQPAGGDGWARLREAQRAALAIPDTGMAVTIDIGEAGDIHPRNKQDVGLRLALWALAETYDRTVKAHSGPLYRQHTIEDGRIRVRFEHSGSGLMVGSKEGVEAAHGVEDGKLTWFAVAGEDRVWHWAEATIAPAATSGLDTDSVVVWSPDVPNPVAVRYAFAMNPAGANLYNREGLPASPFRTDEW